MAGKKTTPEVVDQSILAVMCREDIDNYKAKEVAEFMEPDAPVGPTASGAKNLVYYADPSSGQAKKTTRRPSTA